MDPILRPTAGSSELPSTFRVVHEGRYTYALRVECRREDLWERDESQARERSRGRETVRSYPLGASEARMVVRRCRRGGIWGRIVRDVFLGWGRVAEEIRVSERARERGVPTATILGARCERVLGPLCRAEVITKEIPDSCDLISWLSAEENRADGRRRRRMISAVAGAIRKMHDAGICHADLHLKNILVDGAGAAHIVDLDGATLGEPLGVRQRFANLLRLDRSVRKWKATNRTVTTADRCRLLMAYAGGDAALQEACRRLLRQRKSYPFHRLFWKLMGIE